MRVLATALVLAAALPAISLAGECVMGDEFYLECLEGLHANDPQAPGLTTCLWCVGLPRQWHQRWGNKSERERLFSMRSHPRRDRLIAAAARHLDNRQAGPVAAQVLAFQGVGQAEGVDIFEKLTASERPFVALWYTLAALQDPRTVGFAERRYHEIRTTQIPLEPEIRDKLLDIIDCLFHFQDPDSRALLQRIASAEDDSLLRKYIKDTTGI